MFRNIIAAACILFCIEAASQPFPQGPAGGTASLPAAASAKQTGQVTKNTSVQPESTAPVSSLSLIAKSQGTFKYREILLDWKDASRDREVPVKIYLPEESAGICPLIVFSHGLGGSRESYSYMGKHWASHGYAVIHLQHRGSDSEIFKKGETPLKAFRESVANPDNMINRPRDVNFAIAEMKKLCSSNDPVYKNRVDFSKIGVAGHSFGANTSMLLAGQKFSRPGSDIHSLANPEIKAAVEISWPPSIDKGSEQTKFADVKIPVMHISGTKDDFPAMFVKPEDRRIPFDRINTVPQYLIIFADADHMAFSDANKLRKEKESDERVHSFVLMFTTVFWDSYLRNKGRSIEWLNGSMPAKDLKDAASFERKL